MQCLDIDMHGSYIEIVGINITVLNVYYKQYDSSWISDVRHQI